MSATPQKKSVKGSKEVVEKYPPPDIDVATLDDMYLFECAIKNDYKAVCGAFDAKEHQLASFIIENNLFNKRDLNGKSVFELAAYLGNKEFIKAILERSNEKLDEQVFNLRNQLKPSNSYNFMHYACIWGHFDLCKYLVEQTKLIIDPSNDQHADLISSSTITMQSVKSQNPVLNTKTLGSILLESKTSTGETPKDLAIRYNHEEIVEYLNYAGI